MLNIFGGGKPDHPMADLKEARRILEEVPAQDAFKALDWRRIFDSMSKPAFVFDGRNILDAPALRAIGFSVYSIGKPVD